MIQLLCTKCALGVNVKFRQLVKTLNLTNYAASGTGNVTFFSPPTEKEN